MRRLILAAVLSLFALPALSQSVPSVPSDFPEPGTFCGIFTLCQPAPPVTRDTRG
ncbi:hypothetical protein [Roseicyclus marinus]|uniref:hypothetical protein n=1 Tax=Roseicyclus marinus TaxID=2161673 RepID=UPI00240F1DB9|nr:hypothetical protein [Roseicyclus marinus]MDG3040553.1 hypothetical protein [Roseicyclus marinus]